MYETIKIIHMLLAVATGIGLLLRIFLVSSQSQLLQRKTVTLTYAAVDGTIVLLGIILVTLMPNKELLLGNGWLTAKLIAWAAMFATVFYGVKLAKNQPVRIASVCAGFLFYIYILAAAHHHSPLLF